MISKLSKQQKAILEYLWNWYKEKGLDWVYITKLSWAIANKFDVNNSRIEISSLGYDYKLTLKHRASFSRSLRRLENRGLIERIGFYLSSYTPYTHSVKLTEKGKEICKKLFGLNIYYI